MVVDDILDKICSSNLSYDLIVVDSKKYFL